MLLRRVSAIVQIGCNEIIFRYHHRKHHTVRRSIFLLHLMRNSMKYFVLLLLASFSFAFSRQGTLIVLNKSDHTASLIDVGKRAVVATLPTGVAPHEVAVSPDGRLAVVANYGTGQQPGNSLTVLDVVERKKVRDIDLASYRRPHGIVWVEGPRVAVTVEANKALLIVDVEARNIVDAIETDQPLSHMVVVVPQRKLAFTANIGSGSATVIDISSKRKLKDIPTGAGAEGIDVSPDGKEVWVTNRSAHTVSVIDTDSLIVKTTIPSASFPIRAKFTPDGKYVLVSNAQSGDVAVFDAKEKKEIRRIKMEFNRVNDADQRLFGTQFGRSPVPVGILIEPSGRYAFVANTQADVVTMIDLEEWRIVDRLVAGKEPDGLGYSSR